MRGGWKKIVVLLLIAAQMNLSLERTALADPPAAPSDIPASSGDAVLDYIVYVLNHPFSDGAITLGIIWAISKAMGFSFDATRKLPDTIRNYSDMRKAAREMADAYELRRAEYKDYPKKIVALRKKNTELHAQVKLAEERGAYAESEKLRREIERNSSWMKAMAEKVPVIEMSEIVRGVSRSEKAVGDLIEELRPHAARLVERWQVTKRPDYVAEWLNSDDGKNFLSTEAGKAWQAKYDAATKVLDTNVGIATDKYNDLVKAYNAQVPASEQIPKFSSWESPYGRMGDHFVLTPSNASHAATDLPRAKVLSKVNEICELNLALLGNRLKAAEQSAHFYPNFRSQIWSYGSLGASLGSLWLFMRYYQAKYKKSFLEARTDSRIKDKIKEGQRTAFSGQYDDDKKGVYMLEAYHRGTVAALSESEDKIIALLQKRMGVADEANGKKELLERRIEAMIKDPKAEHDRIAMSMEIATKAVNTRNGETSLENFLQLVYTDDNATKDTGLRRQLTLIYRDAVANLYADIVDERKLDEIEKDLIPAMVEKTMAALPTYAAVKRKKAAAEDAKLQAPATTPAASSTSSHSPAGGASSVSLSRSDSFVGMSGGSTSGLATPQLSISPVGNPGP